MIKSSRRNFALTNIRINWPESSTAKGIYNFDNWTVLRHAFLNTWAKLYLTTDLLILSRVYFKTAFFQAVFRGHKKTSSGCVMCEEGDRRQYSKIGFSCGISKCWHQHGTNEHQLAIWGNEQLLHTWWNPLITKLCCDPPLLWLPKVAVGYTPNHGVNFEPFSCKDVHWWHKFPAALMAHKVVTSSLLLPVTWYTSFAPH